MDSRVKLPADVHFEFGENNLEYKIERNKRAKLAYNVGEPKCLKRKLSNM